MASLRYLCNRAFFPWCLFNPVLTKQKKANDTLLLVESFPIQTKTIFQNTPNILTPDICLMPELSRLPTQLTKEALEVQNGDALACVNDTFPKHRMFKIQPPGRRCQLQLCLLSLEGTWWCTSGQVYTCKLQCNRESQALKTLKERWSNCWAAGREETSCPWWWGWRNLLWRRKGYSWPLC